MIRSGLNETITAVRTGTTGLLRTATAGTHIKTHFKPKQMSNEKYEAIVRQIAEEMAKADRDTGGAKAYIKYINAARVALKHMAEEYDAGYESGFIARGSDNKDDEDDMINRLYDSESLMIARGLIPEPESKS
jgi:hypothetical protein